MSDNVVEMNKDTKFTMSVWMSRQSNTICVNTQHWTVTEQHRDCLYTLETKSEQYLPFSSLRSITRNILFTITKCYHVMVYRGLRMLIYSCISRWGKTMTWSLIQVSGGNFVKIDIQTRNFHYSNNEVWHERITCDTRLERYCYFQTDSYILTGCRARLPSYCLCR